MDLYQARRSAFTLLLALLMLLPSAVCALPEDTSLSLYEGEGMFQGGSLDGPQSPLPVSPALSRARSTPEEQLYQDILAAMAQANVQQITYHQYGVDAVASVIFVSLAGRGYADTNENCDAVYYLYARAVNSNPRYFYYVPNVLFSAASGYLEGLYMIVNADIFDKRDVYEAELAAMLAEALPDASGMCETEIVLAVHDYLVLHTRYDWDAFWSMYRYRDYPNAFSAYGALIEKKAVCQGLSLAFMDMLSRLGIPCAIVPSYTLGHAWNLVYADGGWYHADITRAAPAVFNDPDGDSHLLGQVKHDLFLLSDAESRAAHGGGWTSSDGLPAAPLPHADTAFWKDVDSGMFRIGAYWYYTDGRYDAALQRAAGSLQRTAFGASRTPVHLFANVSFPTRLQDTLYVYDYTANGLILYDAAGETRAFLPCAAPGEMGFGAIAPDGGTLIPAGYLYLADAGGGSRIFCRTDALGDVDATGGLDVRDALRCARGFSKAADALAFARGDVNYDGALTDADAQLICRRITGLLGSLPAF
ncbi:MAG: transglutaminase domain-containing protein [Clostridia bacterium]|nr:transglutaminase domain-containing protein [Clostridia bacterium]